MLSMSKLALQDAAEELKLADDKIVGRELYDAFPKPMRKPHAEAIRAHRLRNEILATRVANRLVNRLGPSARARPDRGRGRVACAGDRGIPGRRAPARPRQAVERDRGDGAARNGPRRIVRDRREQRPQPFVRHPPRRRRRDQRRSACASCSSPACARFRRRRPS